MWEGWRFVGGVWEGVSYVGGVDVCGRWEGEVCRSGEGMWDSAVNRTVGWHM